MTHDESILARRRAQGLSSATAACREAGIFRTLFYCWRALYRCRFPGHS
jgi:hypothetical protein